VVAVGVVWVRTLCGRWWDRLGWRWRGRRRCWG
jgi:hypothetical protein